MRMLGVLLRQPEAMERFAPSALVPLELWSLRHGAVNVDALAAELRLLAIMAQLVARVPVVTYVDAPLFGLAVPLAFMAPLRVVTQRAAVRLAGSSLAGLGVGALALLPLHLARYIEFALPSVFSADLVVAGLATHFVPAAERADVEAQLAAAAGCPPPHTGRGTMRAAGRAGYMLAAWS